MLHQIQNDIRNRISQLLALDPVWVDRNRAPLSPNSWLVATAGATFLLFMNLYLFAAH